MWIELSINSSNADGHLSRPSHKHQSSQNVTLANYLEIGARFRNEILTLLNAEAKAVGVDVFRNGGVAILPHDISLMKKELNDQCINVRR